MEDTNKRRRINSYKKMILRTLLALIVITIVLWIYIIFKINSIEDKIDSLNMIYLHLIA